MGTVALCEVHWTLQKSTAQKYSKLSLAPAGIVFVFKKSLAKQGRNFPLSNMLFTSSLTSYTDIDLLNQSEILISDQYLAYHAVMKNELNHIQYIFSAKEFCGREILS